jgi:hypothetical protein
MPSVKTRKKTKAKPPRRPAPKPRPKARPKAEKEPARSKAAKAPARTQPAPAPPKTPPRAGAKAADAARPVTGAATATGRPAPRKSSRKERTTIRRGPNGEILGVGEILLPGGVQNADEVLYMFRGCVSAEHPAGEAGVQEILAKRSTSPDSDRGDLTKVMLLVDDRFRRGAIEPQLPNRPALPRRTFQTVIDRAKQRRREIGAFLRGLDLGRTETSHMDAHGEASLDSLMKWAAHLENLSEAREPEQADFSQQHRFLDNLENTTEALIVDIEATLRRLRDRMSSR